MENEHFPFEKLGKTFQFIRFNERHFEFTRIISTVNFKGGSDGYQWIFSLEKMVSRVVD